MALVQARSQVAGEIILAIWTATAGKQPVEIAD
jgi:hypothetical protein